MLKDLLQVHLLNFWVKKNHLKLFLYKFIKVKFCVPINYIQLNIAMLNTFIVYSVQNINDDASSMFWNVKLY